jgi:hypothetical protein
MKIFLALIAIAAFSGSVQAETILFVGNSYTFGRVDPVMSYNSNNVTDLTRPGQAGRPSFDITTGSNPYEPHNWGGVAGIFKKLTDEAGLNYDVSISARNAASLRGQYLNTSNTWDLQSNLASQKWDKVVLQDLSDEPLPTGKSSNANQALFNFYANKIEDYIHAGIQAGTDAANFVLNTTESLLWGGPTTGTNAQKAALCVANSGLSQASCNTARTIKGNANENSAAEIFLYQTWARPDMIYPHTNTVTNATTGAIEPGVGAATNYYGASGTLEQMTTDLHNSYFGLASSNSDFKGVAAVGDAFMRAVQQGVATRNPYDANALTDGLIDLWWDDNLHASKYGSYLSALTLFGTITGLDPQSLGYNEIAAQDLGISSRDAYLLQQVAAEQLGFSQIPEPGSLCLVFLALGLAGVMRRRNSQ